jgi:broad specificity phosphatase PhoE
MRVTIDFYRHGLSCANAIDHYHWNKLPILWMHDPRLTKQGAVDAQQMSEVIEQPQIVLSSVLYRAIETASLLFHQSPVYVVPHIRERSMGVTNHALTPSQQRKRMHAELVSRVVYRFVSSNEEVFDHGTQGHDWDHFRGWLEQHLPLLCFLNRISMETTATLHIGMVGHSDFMREVFSKTQMNRPHHMGCIRLLYDYTQDARLQAVCPDPQIDDFQTLSSSHSLTCPGIINVGVAMPLEQVSVDDCF